MFQQYSMFDESKYILTKQRYQNLILGYYVNFIAYNVGFLSIIRGHQAIT